MLAAPAANLEWITGACRMFRTTFFDKPMAEAERRNWVLTFFDALKDIPAPFTEEAVNRILRSRTNCPTPAAVRIEASSLLRDARDRLRLERPPQVQAPPLPDLSEAQLTERRLSAERLMREMGFTAPPARSNAEVPTWPRPMSDAAVADLAQETGRRTPERLREVEGISRPEDVAAARAAIRARKQG